MYYRTLCLNNNPTIQQLSIDDLYNGIIPETTQTDEHVLRTIRVETVPRSWLNNCDRFNSVISNFLELNEGVEITYTEYRIPKHSGGYRTISAPSEELKETLRELQKILERWGAYAHTSAYAYVKNRTCLDAIKQHQSARNKWFYKFDLDSFFPSCTTQVLYNTLKYVYPFCLLSVTNLNAVICLATYNGALPQGSPLSPLMCNMVMTSFDWAMFYAARHFNGTYTRYADDLLFSFNNKMQLSFVENLIKKHLPEGLKLNRDKSRCGSIAGKNFNLGLVLNKNNQITIGHKKKMELKAKINNFIYDFTNGNYWSIIDTQVLQGELNYFKTIEPDYAMFVITRLERKHNTNKTLSTMFADIIAGRVGV